MKRKEDVYAILYLKKMCDLSSICHSISSLYNDCFISGCSQMACITDCVKRAEGDYQSCNGCNVYASCTSAGGFIDDKPCPTFKYWDDDKKECAPRSSTCLQPVDWVSFSRLLRPREATACSKTHRSQSQAIAEYSGNTI